MSHITEQKCPNCGAPMRFDPASGLLVCDNCGTKVNVTETPPTAAPQGATAHHGAEAHLGAETHHGATAQQPQDTQAIDQFEGLDFDQLLDSAADPDAEALPIYNCVSCGAEVIAPPEQVALTCPYCRNNIVLTDKVSGKLRPDGVIPFRIQSKDLPAAVRNFYRGKKLLPRGFFSEATMGKVTGVYVPFWVFSGKLSGRLFYDGIKVKSYQRGDYTITESKYYRLIRDAALDFKNLPVDAGSKVDDRMMDSLEPFKMEEAQKFDMRYLAGFTADRFDQSSEDLADRAKNRMATSTLSLTGAQAYSGYTRATPVSHSLHADLGARYLLFPVYMFDINHRNKSYHFAVNGQTGKVVGELPSDQSVRDLYFVKHAGLLSAALMALQVLLYMLGH